MHPNPNPPAPNIGPSDLSSLRIIKFTKSATLPQVFSCILLVQFTSFETLPKLISTGTKR